MWTSSPEVNQAHVLQARVALRLPWWSLATGFAAVRQMAGLEGDASAVQKALKEQTYAANGALPPGAMPAKDDRQVSHMGSIWPGCLSRLCTSYRAGFASPALIVMGTTSQEK